MESSGSPVAQEHLVSHRRTLPRDAPCSSAQSAAAPGAVWLLEQRRRVRVTHQQAPGLIAILWFFSRRRFASLLQFLLGLQFCHSAMDKLSRRFRSWRRKWFCPALFQLANLTAQRIRARLLLFFHRYYFFPLPGDLRALSINARICFRNDVARASAATSASHLN